MKTRRTVEQIAEDLGVSNNKAKKLAKRKANRSPVETIVRGTVPGTGKPRGAGK